MNAQIFAEWLRRRGYTIAKTHSSYWFNVGPRVYQAFPYHCLIQPGAEELDEIMRRHAALALRYSTLLAYPDGMISYHMVLANPYDLNGLRPKSRSSIRQGLKHCQVEPLSLKRLSQEGWVLQRDTLERQGRTASMSQSEWECLCLAAEGLPGFEAWGATVKGELAASVLMGRIDEMAYFLFAQSKREFMGMQVNNALFYSVSREMLAREGIAGIFGNLHSLDAPLSVDRFKSYLGFTAKPVRQRILFHPWLSPFANRLTHTILAWMLQHHLGNHLLGKAEGILRFYLQGKRPPFKQDWPELLAPRRKELLEAMSLFGKGNP